LLGFASLHILANNYQPLKWALCVSKGCLKDINLEKWEKTRAKGKKRFLWVNGFLGWGVMTAILWSIIMEVSQPSENLWIRPIIALILFPIGGLAWGHFVWKYTEKKFITSKDEQNT
jgi:hypothetical protein